MRGMMVAAICLVVLAMSLQTLALENSELKDKLAVGVRDAAKDAGGERRQLKQHRQSGERGLGPHKAPPLSASARRPGLAPATDAAIVAFLNKVGMTWEDVKHEEALRWLGKGIDDKDCKTIAHLIASGSLPKLTYLKLDDNQIGDAGMSALASAIASGSMAKLAVLSLSHNTIGDADMSALAGAIASGSLGTLNELYLASNQIGDAGMTEFSRTIASGSLRNLTVLDLDNNQIGDVGMAEFSRAIASGSLRNLTWLDLDENEIGDAGMAKFSRAIASGSLPSLQIAYLSLNPGSGAPVQEALAQRK